MTNHMCCNCHFYRFKADSGDGPENEIGICDNPATNEQIKPSGVTLALSILSKHIPEDEYLRNLESLRRNMTDFRVQGDFGCLNWEGETT